MDIIKLIESIEKAEISLLKAAIEAGENLNVHCPITGRSLATIISAASDEIYELVSTYSDFNWNMPNKSIEHEETKNHERRGTVTQAKAPSAQARLWAQQFLLPQEKQSVYHIPVGLELAGALDINAVKQALISLMNQHDVLRCLFEPNDEGLNIVAATSYELPFEEVSLTLDSPELVQYCQRFFEEPFDLKKAPLWRVSLIRHHDNFAYLYFVYHHIIVDGDSLDILLSDFTTYYNHSAHQHHAQAAVAEKQPNYFLEAIASPRLENPQDKAYWVKHLQNFPEFSQPMLDKTRPALPSYQGQIYRFDLELPENINDITKEYQTTLSSLMFATYNLLLYKLTGQQDIIIGTPTSSRVKSALKNTVGYFIDTLPIRSQIKPTQMLSEFITQVVINKSEAYTHQSIDFPGILESLQVKNNPSITPLFQCFFIMMEANEVLSFKLNGLKELTSLDARGIHFNKVDYTSSKYDLTLRVDQQGAHLACSFEFASDCYQESTVALFADYFQHLLGQVFDFTTPKQCAQLSLPEKQMVLASLPDITQPPCLLEKIKHHAKYRPSQCALRDNDVTINYKTLWKKVSNLAIELKARVSTDNPVIAIMMERGASLVISQLAIMAIGGAYVPIDPDYPHLRKRAILSQSKACLLLSHQDIADEKIERFWPSDNAKSDYSLDLSAIKAEKTAYILFTSGSTGDPKGIAVSYGALMSFLQGVQDVIPLSTEDVWLSVSSPSFDISGYEYFAPLSMGGTCFIADKLSVQDGGLLKAKIAEVKPTIMQATPITWENLAESHWMIPSGFRMLCGGEKLSQKAYAYLTQSAGHAYQLYGPTEATIWATYSEIRRGFAANNIGRPLPHMRAFVLGDDQKPLPPMVAGELYLAGHGLADGYWQDDDKTQKSFVTLDSMPTLKLYRTGDKVRLMLDGTIEYICRIDTQLKLNGYRIEAGDIEAVCKSYDGIEQCVVVDVLTEASTQLVACVQAKSDLNPELVMSHIKQRLPDYMVPAAIYQLKTFPVNNRGKTDKAQLAMDYLKNRPDTSVKRSQKIAETTDLSHFFVDYLRPFAQDKAIDRDLTELNFFDLGLKSRHIIDMAQKLSEIFEQKVQAALFYQYTTPRLLLEHLNSHTVAKTLKLRMTEHRQHHEPIAIVGIACRYAGANNKDELWTMLSNVRSGLYRYNAKQLTALNVSEILRNDNHFVPVSGRLNGIDLFDATFFNFQPKEASLTSPAQRIFMELAWHALEDANNANFEARHEKVGIFAGCGDNDYLSTGGYQNLETYQTMLGTEKDYFTTRIAFKLGLTGPAVNIQTACSSSLTALHYAINSIQMGECAYAIAGGVSIVPVKAGGYLAKPGFMFSPSGHCAPFSDKADGIVATQGAGAVVLKPLSKAQLDGDYIYGLIKGSAVNNDGSKKASYDAPSPEKQAEVIEMALQRAEVSKDSISYIEAHGTGTVLGDPIEVNGLKRVYGEQKKQSIVLGAGKSNVGHSIHASGIFGVIKTSLALEHKILPGTLYARTTNREIDFESSPFKVQHETEAWSVPYPRRAGVSSFGIGGTNVHAILEEAPIEPVSDDIRLENQWQGLDDCEVPSKKSQDNGPWLFGLSAKTEDALRKQIEQLIKMLKENRLINLADLSYTLSVGRAYFKKHIMVEASSVDDLIFALQTVFVSRQEVIFAHGFKRWYQDDAYFNALVQSSSHAFEKIAGLGRLTEALSSEYPTIHQQKALELIYLYSALRRIQACGISLDALKAQGIGRLACDILNGHLNWTQALNDALTLDHQSLLQLHGIDIYQGQAAFRKLIKHAFVNGTQIDWQGYWRGSIRQKILIPLYPFQRERYWHDNEPELGLIDTPDLDDDDDEKLQFKQELNLSNPNFAYLKAHQVFSFYVFPGAAYTEFLLFAARKIKPDAPIEIQELSYEEPLQLVEGQTRICQIELETQDNVHFTATIMSYEDGAETHQVIHAKGRFMVQSVPKLAHVWMDEHYSGSKDVAQIYQNLAKDGVHYGDEFRGVKTFSFDATNTKALSQIALSGVQSTTDHTIHPILLDSAFQSMAGILLLDKEMPLGMTYIPAGHGAVHFYREMSASGYVKCRVVPTQDDKILSGNLDIYTENKDLAISISGLKLVQIAKTALEKRLSENQGDDIYYQLNFEAGKNIALGQIKRTWLVIDKHQTYCDELRDKLMLHGDNVRVAHTIDHQLLSHLNDDVGVIYLDALNDHQPQALANEAWNLMQWVKLFKHKNVKVNRFMVVSQYEQGIYQGFCNSLSAARSNWQVSLLHIRFDEAKFSQIVCNEACQDSDTEMMVSYHHGERFVGRINRYKPQVSLDVNAHPFKPNDYFLITGGLGGLGLRVADWLVNKGAQNLYLLSQNKREKLPEVIEEWRKKGINIKHEPVDVSDKPALSKIFADINQRQGSLVGVFHLAGVLRDAMMENLKENDFQDVFAPKVLGAENLHELTINNQQLRFFVLFSSLVSIIGSPAQINYAAANSYFDALLKKRQALNLPAQQINYGAWADVGMAANLSQEQKRYGMDQISVAQGLKAMELAMQQKNQSMIVAKVDWAAIWHQRSQFGLVSKLIHQSTSNALSHTAEMLPLSTLNSSTRLQELQTFVITLLTQATGENASVYRENLDKGFDDLGLTSMSMESIGQSICDAFPKLNDLDTRLLYTYASINKLVIFLNQKIATMKDRETEHVIDTKTIRQWVKATLAKVRNLSSLAQQIIREAPSEGLTFDNCQAQEIPLPILAALSKKTDMMVLMVETGLDISVSLVENPIITPLTVAVAMGHERVVEYLVSHLSDIPNEVLAMNASKKIKSILEMKQERRYEKN